MKERLTENFKSLPLIISFISIMAVFYDFGFDQSTNVKKSLNFLYQLAIFLGITWTIGAYFGKKQRIQLKVIVFDSLSVLFFAFILIHDIEFLEVLRFYELQNTDSFLYSGVFLAAIREFSIVKFNLKNAFLNPAQLFILSFLIIVLLGTILLLLPNATVAPISFIDALFTSTSAVCVTGLIVLDTGSQFTFFGHCILLCLFQIGGLGIMTFASYFSYFFRGGASYSNQTVLSSYTNSDKLGEVFSTLKKIILVTFSIELIGALIIFSSLQHTPLNAASLFEQVFFSIFHAVSAFCNAGFTFLSSSLFTTGFQYSYGLQSTILVLFIFGGLGFPIVFNLVKYISYLFKNKFIPFILRKKRKSFSTPWVLNLNSRITLITTFILLFLGSLIFYLFEYQNSLGNHGFFGKIIISIFSAATPRSGGFNVIDTSSMQFSTTMLIILLMWIGASPASTGGGIKTSTFAIATLNFLSLARGKSRIEIFRREVADITVRRAFAIISLSLVSIGFGVFLIAHFDREKDLLQIAFECFSAYCTVGLSLGITDQLSSESKLVITALMFTGRVSMLTMLIAFLKREKFKNYQYPEEELLIN